MNSVDFSIENWPVGSANNVHLDAIKASHVVDPLPVFDVNGHHIDPSEYEEKLAGAITWVCFSIMHFLIKQKHIFNAVVCDITVLHPPTTIVRSSASLKGILHPQFDSRKKVRKI